jgi:flagellar basal body P-ring protein FlgI
MIRLILLFMLAAGMARAEPVRIKDLVEFDGVRATILWGMVWLSA